MPFSSVPVLSYHETGTIHTRILALSLVTTGSGRRKGSRRGTMANDRLYDSHLEMVSYASLTSTIWTSCAGREREAEGFCDNPEAAKPGQGNLLREAGRDVMLHRQAAPTASRTDPPSSESHCSPWPMLLSFPSSPGLPHTQPPLSSSQHS